MTTKIKKILADQALKEFIKRKPLNVLMIGDRLNGEHFKIMNRSGLKVTTIDRTPPADVVSDYMDYDFEPHDAIWCSHTLEHQRNPGLFIDKIFRELKEGGLLGVTVPPASEELKGGHVTIWNKTILAYQLILSGFNCSEAMVWGYGYNISYILKKKTVSLKNLTYSKTDLPILKKYMPYARSKQYYIT